MKNKIPSILQERARRIQFNNPNKMDTSKKSIEDLIQDFNYIKEKISNFVKK
jgi:hypothetical protein